MNRYWNERLRSLPRAIDVDEASEMATWIPSLEASIEPAVALALRSPLGLGSHNELLRLLDADHFRKAPAAFVRLITHALITVEGPFWGGYQLQRIVGQARALVGPDQLTPLIEQAMRLGYTEAPVLDDARFLGLDSAVAATKTSGIYMTLRLVELLYDTTAKRMGGERFE